VSGVRLSLLRSSDGCGPQSGEIFSRSLTSVFSFSGSDKCPPGEKELWSGEYYGGIIVQASGS
jgi:hypothetical protein